MKKRIMSLCAITIISSMAISLTACGSSEESAINTTSIESGANENSMNSKQESGNNMNNKGDAKTIAKITAIDGNNITFVTADRGQKPDGQMENEGRPSEPPTGDNREQPLEPPTGGDNVGKPDNEPPKGDKPDGQMPEMNFGTEEKTVTVDSSIIFIDSGEGEKTAGSISDLGVDSVIDITFDDDGISPKEILVKSK